MLLFTINIFLFINLKEISGVFLQRNVELKHVTMITDLRCFVKLVPEVFKSDLWIDLYHLTMSICSVDADKLSPGRYPLRLRDIVDTVVRGNLTRLLHDNLQHLLAS